MRIVARGRRPRVAGVASTERIWAWITPEEKLALEAIAATTGESVAVIVREAVNSFVNESGDGQIFSVTGNSKAS
jgi:hypothetical protein